MRVNPDVTNASQRRLIAGFAILEAKSLTHATEMTEQFLSVAGDGECEVRPMFSPADCGPEIH